MKRFIFIVAALMVSAAAYAQGNLAVKVGDAALDAFLSGVANDYAAGRINKNSYDEELKYNFGLSKGDFNMLISKGYNAGDAYLLGMLHRRSGKSIDELIKNRRPGQGWGELAHQLGIPPSELNKMRVAKKKEWQAYEKSSKHGKYGDVGTVTTHEEQGQSHGKKDKGEKEHGQGKGKNK